MKDKKINKRNEDVNGKEQGGNEKKRKERKENV